MLSLLINDCILYVAIVKRFAPAVVNALYKSQDDNDDDDDDDDDFL